MSAIESREDHGEPEITVVTVVKDHPLGLVWTIESLLQQTFKNWKAIIIVGDSTDNTLEVAQRYSKTNENILTILQNGVGIYQAMNQATKLVSSKYVWYMNAGDRFFGECSMSTAIREAEEEPLVLLIGGHKIDNGRDEVGYSFQDKILTPFWFSINRRFGCHQAMLFLTSKVKALGCYNTKYKITADFDLVMRLCSIGVVRRSPSMLAIVEPGGGADQNIVFVHREKQLVRKALLGSKILVLMGQIWTELAILKIQLKKFISYKRREARA